MILFGNYFRKAVGWMKTKVKSLAELFPNLVLEWNYERNGDLTPYMVTPGSSRKVWWICSHGHEWEAIISNRTSKICPRGCPFCSNHLLTKENCLANKNSELAKDWCYELNGEHTPDNVQAGGKLTVWWECHACGHRWQAQIYQRNKGHYLCPYCNSLAKTCPELLADWNYEKNTGLDPTIIGAGSHEIAQWKCHKCGYEWQSAIVERKLGHKTCVGCHSIAVTHPNVIKDWDSERNWPLTPYDVTSGSNKIVWWHCSRNPKHRLQRSVQSYCKTGCSICSKGRNTSINEISFYLGLLCIFPDALSRHKINGDKKLEVDIWIPSLLLAIEYDSHRYHKSEDKVQLDAAKDIALNKIGIRLIRIREELLPSPNGSEVIVIKILDWRKSLKQSFSELIATIKALCEGSNLDIAKMSILSKNVDIDLKQIEAQAYIANVPEKESLAYNYPDLIKEWHPTKNGELSPWDVRPFANFKVWWKCPKCGYEWMAVIGKRTIGRGCPLENGRGSALIITEKNSLGSCFPDIAKELDPELNDFASPDQIYQYSLKVFQWRCFKNQEHVWSSSVADRTRKGHGCPLCTPMALA